MKNRRDGKIVKDINGMFQLMLDLKPNRCDSDVFINQKMDVTNLVKYVEKKKKEGNEITYFHAFLAAIGKTMYNRPNLNRFIANRHVYEHNDITIAFVAKVSFDDKSEEVMIIIPIEEHDNINTIGKKVKDKIDSIRQHKMTKEGANNALDTIGSLPNIIRVPLMGLFKWMDKKDLLPKDLIKDNAYYSSMMVSNLGAIKCGAIYHNLTNFGTCSSLATMGEIRKEEIINNKDKKEIRSICEFGVNFDERVADGYYFAKSIQLLQYLLNNPELLEEDASKKIKVDELR